MKYVEGSKRVFMNTGTRFPRKIVWSVALIKKAAAQTNTALGIMDKKMGSSIVKAADEVARGLYDDQVVVDVFQTGSGTGINMNVNELISERATALLGAPVHPNDHVNMSQSSNDVVPTAIRLAAIASINESLVPGLAKIVKSLTRLEKRTSGVYKSGRTHLRDALPITMGQEFGAFADAFENDLKLVKGALSYLSELPIGGTAVGTGLNSDSKFASTIVKVLKEESKLDIKEAENRFRAMRSLSDMNAASAAMRITALDLHRLCQDIRLMFSGPLTGLAEIDIPTQEEVAGSSIMPGKTNPVTVEAALLVSAQVVGLDQANHTAGMLGEFELSMAVPLMGYNVVTQVNLLSEALNKISELVVDHIVPQEKRARYYAETSPSLITVISPKIGYDKAAKIGKELSKGASLRGELKELGYSESEIEKILDMSKLVKPGILK